MNIARSTIGWFWVAGQALVLGFWIITLPALSLWWRSACSSVLILAATLILLTAGLLLALLSTLHLGRSLTPTPEPRSSGKLVTHGVYRYARHPMYGAILLLVWGATLPVAALLTILSASVVTVFFRVKSTYEERRLERRFPDYASYRLRTHRFFPLPSRNQRRV